MKKILLTVGMSTAIIFGIQAQETPEKTQKQEEVIEARGNTTEEVKTQAESAEEEMKFPAEFASEDMTKISTSELPKEVHESFKASDFKGGTIEKAYEISGVAMSQILESRANRTQYAGDQLPDKLYMLHVDIEDGLGVLYLGSDGRSIAEERLASSSEWEKSLNKTSNDVEQEMNDAGEAVEEEVEQAEANIEEAANETEEALEESEESIESAAYSTEEAVENAASQVEESTEQTAQRTENAVEGAEYETEEAVERTSNEVVSAMEETESEMEEAANETETAIEATANETEETVESAAYKTEQVAENTANEVESEMEETENEMEEAANETETAVESAAYETEEAVESTANEAKSEMKEAGNEVEESAENAAKEAKETTVKKDGSDKVLVVGAMEREKLQALTDEFESKGLKKISSSAIPQEVSESFKSSDYSEGTIEQAYEVDGAVLPQILESRANMSYYAGEQLPETLYMLHVNHEKGLSVLYIGNDGEVIASEDM